MKIEQIKAMYPEIHSIVVTMNEFGFSCSALVVEEFFEKVNELVSEIEENDSDN